MASNKVYPRGLNAGAHSIWDEVYDDIIKRYELNNFELPLLVRYCNILCQIEKWEARDVLDNVLVATARGTPQMNPEYKAYNECMKALMQIADRFGLTPKSRTKLDHAVQNKETDTDDGMDGFLNGE